MRADLLALTTDALAALTNRGLVKRAGRAVESGDRPTIRTDPDGSVRADFSDGVRTTLSPGGLDAAHCTCGATTTCRHALATILTYQADPPTVESPAPVAAWSPGAFTDTDLEAAIGKRAFAAARRIARSGYQAQVHRPTPDDPAPRVDLPACTVRFLVPHDLGYVHSDAAHGGTDHTVALAVWAFRVADEQDPEAGRQRVDVGSGSTGPLGALDDAVALANDLLLDGAAHATPLLPAVAAVAKGLDGARLRWPLLALEDIADQLTAYAERSARYRPEQLAELLAELHCRRRAAARGASVLGTEEAAETQLRRVRLTGLGCRVTSAGPEQTADIFLADPMTATVLTLRHRWTRGGADGQPAGSRRVVGTTIAALAGGNLLSESAVRTASRRVRLPAGRLSRNSVLGSAGEWGDLPPGILTPDLAALTAELDRLPPRLIRPRVDAEAVRVIPVAEVRSVHYAPGDQRLDAVVADATGATATVSAVHRSASPGALDALAEALPKARFLSGLVRRGRGGLVISPLAVVVADTVVVPDLATAGGELATHGDAAEGDELGRALDDALGLLAELAHRGGHHLPPTYPDRLRTAATTLTNLGLARCGQALTTVAGACGSPDRLPNAWTDAQIRLLVAADNR
ncbi:hypothetical protein SAMN05421812_116161 [Asanoa hainanensis]|uniref:SWIM-type domain-containing protein n=1 Tax=Asanoa hainanensis TaxID=560556 RepID=A0A239PCB3_9ACTN|nr:hypothetical protein [Asanoa hainanensis]SNT64228.1 hypothetical protein SAMN05421812_116161 [Asanoa hainanensis]